MKVGISFGLGDLRGEQEARAALPILRNCDYVGISFYPYASGFDEKFGAPPYRGASPWREPLAWIRAYTDKPIAICETGCTSQPIDIPMYGLHLPGSIDLQTRYTRELFETARRDRYLFVVWFLAVDYDKLYAKLPPGSDAALLWKNIGFLDSELRPKTAWAIWRTGVAASRKQR